MSPLVKAFFDDATNTISYVVRDPAGTACAIIDSVLDFDYSSGRTDTASADEIIAYVKAENLEVQWLLESHVHADHLSAAPYLQQKIGGKIGIGDRITVVQDTFGKVFNEGTAFQRDGSQFDALFKEGDSFHIGQMRADVLHMQGKGPGRPRRDGSELHAGRGRGSAGLCLDLSVPPGKRDGGSGFRRPVVSFQAAAALKPRRGVRYLIWCQIRLPRRAC